ncbi:diaminopimelate decarboxylase [Anseongella ginsenosidimutans]|uniref:Diaminopimelate decarboxylase n=1 Tax=Anseongella ginsenosidimutans TaxID=496056 RepID=A0A4R3KSD2_9SPHI|nr:diaminopimelate decarboxylase [Anseongella ginsenosidimutans]QEC53253.1 diaminopimelate decarboxylase [Anseongella ginsenosidimutans]TCS87890.1 diaminopimelate decarboxylase [Anseongella ginsenosidimutans]
MFTAARLARFQQEETPFYFYDMDLLRQTVAACRTASEKRNFHVHYALKANVNNELLGIIREAGFGADCVSGGEVEKALENGFRKDQIVFAGVGKSDREINYALDQDIFCFNVESVQELEVINELARARNKRARIALRINPNVNANTHHYITTGLEENKFGINSWEFDTVVEKLRSLENIDCAGLHFHIGSQVTDENVFKSLCVKVNEFKEWFAERGVYFKLLNVGGGLGVDYHAPDVQPIVDFERHFAIFEQFLELDAGQEVHFELGRALVAQCGSLITKVLYIKKGINTNFAVVDAGMTELIRPALYHAYHKIENISASSAESVKYDVVGPICESSDCFGKEVELPETSRGDLMAIRTAGAYGEVMTSSYNLRPKIRPLFL